jgi:hypothetical protein
MPPLPDFSIYADISSIRHFISMITSQPPEPAELRAALAAGCQRHYDADTMPPAAMMICAAIILQTRFIFFSL